MLTHPTLDRLNALGLHGMAKAFADIEAAGEAGSLGHAEWLALLLEREASLRHDKRLATRLRYAKLRQQACVEDIDYRTPRGLDRPLGVFVGRRRRDDQHLLRAARGQEGTVERASFPPFGAADECERTGHRVKLAPVLRGDQVTLRPVTETDVDALVEFFAVPEVAEWWPGENEVRLRARLDKGDEGVGLCRRLRAQAFRGPILLMGNDPVACGGAARLVEELALGYVGKPFTPSDVLEAIVRAMRLSGVRRPAAGPSPPPLEAAGRPLRILLAEDNAVNQKLALRILSRMGHETQLAEDGQAAVDALAEGDFDLVLMDVQMPRLDGLEATRQIRERWPDRPIHIVGLTANAMAGDREACLAAGMNDYVSKPIRPDELARAIAATPAAAGRSA